MAFHKVFCRAAAGFVLSSFGLSLDIAWSQEVASSSLVSSRTIELKNPSILDAEQFKNLLHEDWDTTKTIRWDIAKKLAAVSYQVYEEQPQITDIFLAGLGFESLTELQHGTMYGYVASQGDVAVIAFRGTNMTSFSDWATNVTSGQQSFHGQQFHRGFVDAYLALKPRIVRLLNDLKPKHLWITGHSLGGALAVVASVDLKQQYHYEPQIVTFGQPRVTDSSGAIWLDSQFGDRYARFVNGSDIIPNLPPTIPLVFQYAHAGDLYAFGERSLTIDESQMSIPPMKTEYCGSCGRTILNASSTPIYQTQKEQAPLTQEEFARLLNQEVSLANSRNLGTADGQVYAAWFPGYFSDHKMGRYLESIYSFGSMAASYAIPGK
jgi:triacylglycerol lipase